VEDQRADPGSLLHLVRDLLALRRRTPDLHGGDYHPLTVDGPGWAWRRGDGHVVAVGMGDGTTVLEGVSGRVLVGTDRARDGARVPGRLVLSGWEGVVVGPGPV